MSRVSGSYGAAEIQGSTQTEVAILIGLDDGEMAVVE